ncbi:SGNH/GDSL hydrolase family protein [Rubinisphaera italica]|uniref:GDSL-like Lipase/Acylhydrolase n=1 Tax=Rubinisphaera italica TaxID=2527969 RepID=A0A5C5XKJ7_9PLAN|nr:SGNH/GDSL hydrolase family protein [Rubinisphaera italica]TWT62655.1 GDSL-like Lipase/Acylhydrolase [Rubinisphaera italica]
MFPLSLIAKAPIMKHILAGLALVVGALSGVVSAETPVLEKGDRLAIIGDSITEQKLYSKFIETYLLACYPELEIQTFQFGWGGERAPGFAARMENDLVPWTPDVVTTCYGMNDGSYREYTEQIGKTYEEGMRRIIDRMQKAGATIVVGSPGVVDSFTWQRGNPEFDQVYNDNLKHLGQIANELAKESKSPHADVFGEMMKSMKAAKAELGEEYPVAGGDGVHPGANGHLLMAYAFLKALGLDGKIGTITVDLSADKVEATTGHKVLNNSDGKIELESNRYPFCFYGGYIDPNGTSSILPYTQFDEEMNRFILKVTGLETPRAEVTFGESTKIYTWEELKSGINLATDFQDNPFVEPFKQVMNEVARKQAFETQMIKGIVTNFRQMPGELADDPEVQNALNTIRRKMTEIDDAAYQKAKSAVKPVQYTITVRPLSFN